jgi:hypothetical protein
LDHVMCEVLLEFFAQETVFPGPSASFSPLKSTASDLDRSRNYDVKVLV